MVEHLKKAAALNPNDELLREAFDSLRKEAFELAEAGQIERAAALYRQMIDILPQDAKSHYNLAMMLKRRGDPDGAMRHYQEAVRLDPGYALALFQMAEIYAEKGIGQRSGIRISPRAAGSSPTSFPPSTIWPGSWLCIRIRASGTCRKRSGWRKRAVN